MQQQDDAADIERCLARAAALPPEERTPEVLAFVFSVQLLRDVDQLLPLTADGKAAVPATPATRRQALAAMLKVVLADYLCPEVSVCRPAMFDRLVAYMHCIAPAPPCAGAASGGSGSGGSSSAAAGGGEEDCEALAEVLRLYMTAWQAAQDFEGVQIAAEAAAALAQPEQQAAVQRALELLAGEQEAVLQQVLQPGEQHAAAHTREQQEQAAGGSGQQEAAQQAQQAQQVQQAEERRQQRRRLPSLDQLRYACCHLVAEAALQVGVLAAQRPGASAQLGTPPPPRLSAVQRVELRAAERRGLEEVMRLEPENPKSLAMAALASGGRGQPPQRAAEVYLSAHRAARQQGSDWWAALAASRALVHAAEAARGAGGVEAETLGAALAAWEGVEAALARCKGLLPQAWVDHLEAAAVAPARPLVADVRTQLGRLQQQQQQQQGPQPEGQGSGAAAPPSSGCDHCGMVAAELLRCTRCRNAVYCSRECQKAAWKQHKLPCRPA